VFSKIENHVSPGMLVKTTDFQVPPGDSGDGRQGLGICILTSIPGDSDTTGYSGTTELIK